MPRAHFEAYTGPDIGLLNTLPPELYKTIPLALPPPGVVANFQNPPTRVPVSLGISITYLVIASICLGIRTYTRTFIVKKWKWDDWLVVTGFSFSIACFASLVLGYRGGIVGRHGWDVHLDKALSHDSLLQSYLCTVMSAPALGFIKMSLFVQYYYLFGVMRYIRISVLIIGTLTTIFYISISIAAFAMNSPWPGESLLDVIVSWHYLNFAKSSIATGIIGMLVDWILLFLPVPAVWGLKISRRKKASVMLIFMTGTLGAIASVLSLYYRVVLQQDPTDTTWKVGYTLLWTQVEMWSGVTASCMPTVKQFFSHYFPTASLKEVPKLSSSHFKHENQEKSYKSRGAFRLWGYKSSADTESTEPITQGSNRSHAEAAEITGLTANESGQPE